jgi:hypothetical protein
MDLFNDGDQLLSQIDDTLQTEFLVLLHIVSKVSMQQLLSHVILIVISTKCNDSRDA